MIAVVLSIGFVCANTIGCSQQNQYTDDEVSQFISEYLTLRYNDITSKTILERIEEQNQYYCDQLLAYPAWVNYPDNIDASIQYFEEYQYHSQILRCIIQKQNTEYLADLSVLYLSEKDPYYDNYVDYILSFQVVLEEHEMKIKSVTPIKNTTTYIMGGELHVSDKEVILVEPDESTENDE